MTVALCTIICQERNPHWINETMMSKEGLVDYFDRFLGDDDGIDHDRAVNDDVYYSKC